MSEKRTDAWMPLWIGDYLADTMSLTRDQHGAYLLLIMSYWRNGGPLPADDDELAATVRATEAEWPKLRKVLLKFFTEEDGRWHHGRINKELNVASTKATNASQNASDRWGSDTSAEKGRHLRAQRLAEARKKGRHSDGQWEALKAFHGGLCCRCGGDGEIVKDHILPIYKGGSDGIENIQPLCRRCNAAKGPEEVDHRKEGWGKAIDAFDQGIKRLQDACSSPSPVSTSLRSVDGGARKRGTRLADDWTPSEADQAFCRDRRPDLDIETTGLQFRNYWTARSDRMAAKLDWSRTWQNWVLGQKPGPGPTKQGAPPQESFYERDLRLKRERFYENAGLPVPGADKPTMKDVEREPERIAG